VKIRVVRQITATQKIVMKHQIKDAKIKNKKRRTNFKNKGCVGCYLNLSALYVKGK